MLARKETLRVSGPLPAVVGDCGTLAYPKVNKRLVDRTYILKTTVRTKVEILSDYNKQFAEWGIFLKIVVSYLISI